MSLRRKEKLASIYQDQVAAFLGREVKIGKGILSVTKVELDEKLERLKIYVAVWPDTEEKSVLKSLENLKKELRKHLALKVKTRFVPTLEFVLDESQKKQLEVEALLKKLK